MSLEGNKGASTDFLVAHPVLDSLPLTKDLSNEEIMLIIPQKGWEIFFDGASRSLMGYGKRMCIIIMSESKSYSSHWTMHLSSTPSPSQRVLKLYSRI